MSLIERTERPDSPTWARVVAAALVAIGLAVAWGFVLSIFTGQVGARYYGALEESLIATVDGELLISRDERPDVSYRTADGEPFEPKRNQLLFGHFLAERTRERRTLDPPLSWSQRIAGLSNRSRPAAAWYLVRDDADDGSACFEVFDKRSGRAIGFYGREGLRPTEPPKDEWFDLGPEQIGELRWRVESTSNVTQGYYVWDEGMADDQGETIPPWMVYLLDREQVLEIDLRERSHRVVAEAPGAFKINVGQVPQTVMRPAGLGGGASDALFAQSGGAVFTAVVETTAASPIAGPNPRWEPYPDHRLFVRDADSVRVVNPRGGEEWRYAIPEALRDIGFQTFAIGPDEAWLGTFPRYWDAGRVVELSVINADGEVQSTRSFELRGHTPTSLSTTAAVAAAAMPTPLVGGATLAYYPWSEWYFSDEPYGDAAVKLARAALPSWSVVVVVALLLAALTAVTHRREYRDHAAVWAVFVALLGPVGYLAYRLHWGSPPRTRCAACGADVPRDREVCPACGAEWDTPAPNGVEVWDAVA